MVDWKAQTEVSRRTVEEFSCPGHHPETEVDWLFVPETPWLLMVRCQQLYVLDVQTLKIVQKLTERSEGWPRIADVSLDGKYLAIVLGPPDDQQAESVILFGRNEQGWQRLAQWAPFSRPNGGNRIGSVQFVPGKLELAVACSWYLSECSVIIYDLVALKPLERYNLPTHPFPKFPKSTFCIPLGGPFLGRAPDLVIGATGHGAFPGYPDFSGPYDLFLIHQKFPTGEIVKTIGLTASGPIRDLHISPDGELAVSETCDDPQDMGRFGQLTCRLFTVWDTRTGEIVHQSPNGLAGWARWAKPEFSPDGKYLVVLQHNRVEIFELVREQQ